MAWHDGVFDSDEEYEQAAADGELWQANHKLNYRRREMPQYDNEMKFVLFVNNRKRNDKDADYTGTITIKGVEYYLNGWSRKNNVIGGTVKPKQARPTDEGSW